MKPNFAVHMTHLLLGVLHLGRVLDFNLKAKQTKKTNAHECRPLALSTTVLEVKPKKSPTRYPWFPIQGGTLGHKDALE